MLRNKYSNLMYSIICYMPFINPYDRLSMLSWENLVELRDEGKDPAQMHKALGGKVRLSRHLEKPFFTLFPSINECGIYHPRSVTGIVLAPRG